MTNQNERSGPVPEWLVERLAAGELSPARADEIRRRLAAEPGGLDRLKRLADSNEEILAAHPPAAMAAEILRRVGREPVAANQRQVTPRPRRSWTLTLGTPAVAMAALLLAVWSWPRPGAAPKQGGQLGYDDGDRLKGDREPALRVYRKVGDKAERLSPGATTHAHDQLQLAYSAGGRTFGAVLSIDGAGHVTFHLPDAPGKAARLRAGGEVALTDAYELDAAPGFERFLFISGDAPFDTAVLADVVRGAAAPPVGTVSVSFTVRKE